MLFQKHIHKVIFSWLKNSFILLQYFINVIIIFQLRKFYLTFTYNKCIQHTHCATLLFTFTIVKTLFLKMISSEHNIFCRKCYYNLVQPLVYISITVFVLKKGFAENIWKDQKHYAVQNTYFLSFNRVYRLLVKIFYI